MAMERLQHLWGDIIKGDEWRRAEVVARLERSIDDDLCLQKLIAVLTIMAEKSSPNVLVKENCLYNLRLLLRLAGDDERQSESGLKLWEKPSFENTLHFIAPKMLPPLGERQNVDVFTCGSNDRLSLGNPLGTRKMKRIYFSTEAASPQRHFNAEKVAVGPSSTFYIGRFIGVDGVMECRRSVFVSGKFGARHHLLPQIIDTDEEVLCAAVGKAHAVLCSRRSCYVIGDNSKNQLGVRLGVSQVDTLRKMTLPSVLLVESEELTNCVTSHNHTVLTASGFGLFVTGTNVGQMGSYALRQYTNGMDGPKSFTRLLAPNDSLSKSKHIGVELADNVTLLWSGNRVRVFFEYHEYKMLIDNTTGDSDVIGAGIAKAHNSQQTMIILCTSSLDVFVWTKTHAFLKKLTSPVWSMPQHSAGPQSLEMRTTFKCNHNGDFFVIKESILYYGSLVDDEQGMRFRVERAKSPGYTADVFMSPDGENTAYTVLRRSLPHHLLDLDNERVIAERHRLMDEVQSRKAGETPTYSLIEVMAKKRKFYVHRFLLQIRCPSLAAIAVETSPSSVDLAEFDDDVVDEMLDFIYTNSSLTFRIIKGTASERRSCETGVGNGRMQYLQAIPGSRSHLDEVSCFTDGLCGSCGRGLAATCSGEYKKIALCEQELFSTEENFHSNPLLVETLERQLGRLFSIASHAGMAQLVDIISQTLENLQEGVLRLPRLPFISAGGSIGELIPSHVDNILLECTNGDIRFPKCLLQQIPYFEALLRWDRRVATSSQTSASPSVCLEGISMEGAESVLRFLITRRIEQQLTFEQILELFVFADRYTMEELMDELLDILYSELHLENLSELCALARVYQGNERFDEVVVNFLHDYLPFALEAPELLQSYPNGGVPRRIEAALDERLRAHCPCYSEHQSGDYMTACERLAGELVAAGMECLLELNAFSDRVSFSDFLRILRRKQAKRDERQSLKSVLAGEKISKQGEEPARREEAIRMDCESKTPSAEDTLRKINLIESSSKILASSSQHSSEASTPLKWLSTSLPKSPPESLSDIMRNEEERVEKGRRAERVRTHSMQKPVSNKASAKLTPSHKFFRAGSNAWKLNNNIASSPASFTGSQLQPTYSLHQIQESQKLPPRLEPKKSLRALDMEERAVEELGRYYESIFEEGTAFFTIFTEERVGEQLNGTTTDFSISKWHRDI